MKIPENIVELLKNPQVKAAYESATPEYKAAFAWRMKWMNTAHKYQVLPNGDWDIWLLLAGRGAGKGLTLDTPIPTPDGWKLNGDLQDGDRIFDEQGQICFVEKAHDPYMPTSLYRMTFSDGSCLEADGDHLWSTLTHRDRKQMTRHGIKRVPTDWAFYRHALTDCHGNVTGYCGSDVRDTNDLIQTFTHSSRKDLNHCIPTAQPLNLPVAQLPIDPWLLGAWLGDGSSKEQVIWGHVEDIWLARDHAEKLGYQTSVKRDKRNTYGLRILGLSTQLRALGVYGNKHVPDIYMRASVKQRLALLRGLMDTDGYQSSKGVEFCNMNEKLAQAVFELAVSLGEKPTIKAGRATLNGKDCGTKYRVCWRWNRFNPFTLPRKLTQCAAPANQSFKHGHRMIVSIESIEPRMVRCITVNSRSALYLAGRSMIPTHNTRTAAEQTGWWAWSNPKTRWLVAAPTSSDVRSTCFEGDSGLISVIPQILIKDYNKALHELVLVNGSLIKGIPASEPERFRGPQFHGAWFDELAAWEYLQEAWDMAMFGIRLGEKTKIIASTTPKPKELIVDLISRDGNDVAITTASTYDNINNLSSNFRKQILQYEGTKLGRQEIYAEIIDPEEGGIVKRDWFKLFPAKREIPKLEFVLQSYDCATSEKTQNDPTAQITLGVFKPMDGPMSVLILDCWNEHLQYPDLRPKVIEEYKISYGEEKAGKRVDLILIEDKSAGISLIQDLQRAHLPVRAYNPGRADKIQRLSIVSNIIMAGRVWVPESTTKKGYVRDWAEGMISQVCSFPEALHDDYVDCLSQGLRYLRDAGFLDIDPAPYDDSYYADDYKPQRVNPYAV